MWRQIMSVISPVEFMKFCISQGFEFVLVDEDNKIINKYNVDEIDSILDKNRYTHLNMRKSKV